MNTLAPSAMTALGARVLSGQPVIAGWPLGIGDLSHATRLQPQP